MEDFWLEQRRDGRAKDIWQIASYNAKSRTTDYRSTREHELERAKAVIRQYVFSLPAGTVSKKLSGQVIRAMVADPRDYSSRSDQAAHGSALRRSRGKITPLTVPAIPEILRYWEEHAKFALSSKSIGDSLRPFLGFVAQDAVGTACTFDDIDGQTMERYRDWSMGPHTFDVTGSGGIMSVSPKALARLLSRRGWVHLRRP